MKSKLKYRYESFKYMANSQRFKLVVLFSVFVNFFALTALSFNQNYYDAFFYTFTNPYYCSIVFFIILLNTINTYAMVDKNLNYIIRLNNKKEYLIELMKSTIFNNIIVFGIILLIFMTGLNLFYANFSPSTIFNYYNVYEWIYLIFYLVRMLAIILIISVVNVLIINLLDLRIAILINAIIYSSLPIHTYTFGGLINSIKEMPWYFGEYLHLNEYSNFALEILCSMIYLIFSLITTYIIFLITKKFIRQVGN